MCTAVWLAGKLVCWPIFRLLCRLALSVYDGDNVLIYIELLDDWCRIAERVRCCGGKLQKKNNAVSGDCTSQDVRAARD